MIVGSTVMLFSLHVCSVGLVYCIRQLSLLDSDHCKHLFVRECEDVNHNKDALPRITPRYELSASATSKPGDVQESRRS